MSHIRKTWRGRVWEEIDKARDQYFLVYKPINLIDTNHAYLNLVFVSDINNKEIAEIMEKELKIWTRRYPVPTIVFPYDKSEDSILLGSIRNGDLLLGYLDKDSDELVQKWGDFEKVFTSGELDYISDRELAEIYSGLNYKTIDEIEKELHEKINEKRKIKKFVNFVSYVWLIIPILIAVLGFKNYIVGLISFMYSLYKSYKEVRRFKGHKTKKQKKDDEMMRKMKHYYYHCEKNQEGFLKLKQENLEKRSQDRIMQKMSDKNKGH